MKNWITIFYITCSTVFLPLSSHSQTNGTLEKLRLIYEEKNIQKSAEIRLNLAIQLFEQQKLSESYLELNKIPLYAVSANFQNQILYYQGLILFLSANYAESYQKLSQCNILDSSRQQTKQLTEIFCLNYVQNFDSAMQKSINYLDIYTKNLYKKDSLTNLVRKLYAHKPRIKSEKIAQNLALFIPGSGIMYAGKPLEGIFSLSLQAASLSFAVFEFMNHNYISGYVLGLALLQKFYFGSQKRTNEIIKVKNTEKINTFNAKLALILKTLEKQEK